MKFVFIISLILIHPAGFLFAQDETTISGDEHNVASSLPINVTQDIGQQCERKSNFFTGTQYPIDQVFQDIAGRSPQVIAFGEEHGNHEPEAYELYLSQLERAGLRIDCWFFEMDFPEASLMLNNGEHLNYQQLVDRYYGGDNSVLEGIPDGQHEIIKNVLPLLRTREIRPIGIDSLSTPFNDGTQWLNDRDIHMHRQVMNSMRPPNGTSPTCSRAVLTIGAVHLFQNDRGRTTLRERIERSGITMSNNVFLTAGATNNDPSFAKPHGVLGLMSVAAREGVIPATSGGWEFGRNDLVCPRIVRPTATPYGLRTSRSAPLHYDAENNQFWGDFADFDNVIVYSCQRDPNCTRLNQLLERHVRSTGIEFY